MFRNFGRIHKFRPRQDSSTMSKLAQKWAKSASATLLFVLNFKRVKGSFFQAAMIGCFSLFSRCVNAIYFVHYQNKPYWGKRTSREERKRDEEAQTFVRGIPQGNGSICHQSERILSPSFEVFKKGRKKCAKSPPPTIINNLEGRLGSRNLSISPPESQ